jgi:hypothetical protein
MNFDPAQSDLIVAEVQSAVEVLLDGIEELVEAAKKRRS